MIFRLAYWLLKYNLITINTARRVIGNKPLKGGNIKLK